VLGREIKLQLLENPTRFARRVWEIYDTIYSVRRYITRENINMNNFAPSSPPVSEPVFLILLSLVSGQKHGYAILKEIEAISHETLLLSTSTLYGALSRLEEQGYIGRVPAGFGN